MPNQYQLAFLGSFFVVLLTLIATFHFAISYLNSKGYYIGDLILIGLPKDQTPPPMSGRVEIEKIPGQLIEFVKGITVDDFPEVDLPLLGKQNVAQLATSPSVLITAGIVLATALYVKVFHTGKHRTPFPTHVSLTHSVQAGANLLILMFGRSSPC